MDRMLAIVFDNERSAYEGVQQLQALDDEGSIAIYAAAVIAKSEEGKVTVERSAQYSAWDSAAGLAIGTLVGTLGGPAGLMLGAGAGSIAGALSDISRANVDLAFAEDVSSALTPGKFALVTSAEEEWITPLDTRMEQLGATVIRRARAEVSEDQYTRQLAAEQTEIEKLHQEWEQAGADRKLKLHLKINELKSRVTASRAELQKRAEEIQQEASARIKVLQDKVTSAAGQARTNYEGRLSALREEYNRRIEQLRYIASLD